MRWFVFLIGLVAAVPAAAQPKLLQAHAAAVSGYTGPGDLVSGATVWLSCTRGYSATYAASGTGKACNVRRASDNATQDIVILTNGKFDVASYNTFVGTDATASCTIAGTAMACTGASATIHVNDPVTGVGIADPCVVTVTNGSTTATVVSVGTASTSCGTVSVAETVTFQVAGFVTEAYDQSGNTNNAIQATAGTQPQMFPSVTNSLPCMFLFTGSTAKQLSATLGSTVAQPYTVNTVAERVAVNNSNGQILTTGSQAIGFWTSGSVAAFAGANLTASATEAAFHAFDFIFNGASSTIVVDSTTTSGSTSTSSWATGTNYGATAQPADAFACEVGLWPSGFNPTQYGNMHTNDSAFYGTP